MNDTKIHQLELQSIKKYLALLGERIITVEKIYNVRKAFSHYKFFSTVIILSSRSARYFLMDYTYLFSFQNISKLSRL